MYSERLQIKRGRAKSLNGPSTQSPSLNPKNSMQSLSINPKHRMQNPSLNPRGSALRSQSPALSPHHNSKSPSFNPQHSDESASRSPQDSTQSSAFCLHHSAKSPSFNPQHLFIDVSTELLRRGQSVRFRAPGWSMHPTIKEGETIKVAPVAPLDIKRGDILLYFTGRKVIAHRVISIKREKSNSTTQSSTLNPQHLFILRGDASATCDEPVKAQQVLGKVVSVERGGRCVDLYSRRAKMLRIAHAWASRLKRLILRILGKPGEICYEYDTLQ